MIYKPHPYQLHAEQHLLKHNYAGLFMEMGLGKTVVTLTALDRMMFDELITDRVLIIAPKRVADLVWTQESRKWDHLRHFKISKVLGTEKQRKMALRERANIYVINRENIPWLVSFYGTSFPFDCVVIDELSSFKSAKSARFKALRQIRPYVKKVYGLTGTPAPNSLLDLWPQMFLLDQGQRLGKSLVDYRDRYFTKNSWGHGYKLNSADPTGLIGTDICEKEIYDKISDICISMQAADYLQLPPRINRMINVKLSPQHQNAYIEFEKKQVLALADSITISAVNAAALSTKLLQFANGAIYYDEEHNWHMVHDEKLDALEEIVNVANGRSVLVFYSYQHDRERIQKRLAAYKPSLMETEEDNDRWNAGKINLMITHPASAGHGLNLQEGGNIIVWFGMPWSLELYQQGIARIDRQGQKLSVIVHHLVTMGTLDEDVMMSLTSKASGQQALMTALKARIQKYQKAVAA